MQYVGGKFRQRRDFVPAILAHTPNRDRYLEPFVGGGSMLEKMAPHFEEVRASDTHEDLILMWQALLQGWTPPSSITEEEWRALKGAKPSPERGFVGFACSFGAKWFGGYAREKGFTPETFPGRGARSVKALVAGLPTDTQFLLRDYRWWEPQPGTVVYCDPPYAARGVEYSTSGGFDHDSFWSVMDAWSEGGAHVYVSEFHAPTHWVPIAESVQSLNIAGNSPVTRRAKGTQYDRLWVPKRYQEGY